MLYGGDALLVVVGEREPDDRFAPTTDKLDYVRFVILRPAAPPRHHSRGTLHRRQHLPHQTAIRTAPAVSPHSRPHAVAVLGHRLASIDVLRGNVVSA